MKTGILLLVMGLAGLVAYGVWGSGWVLAAGIVLGGLGSLAWTMAAEWERLKAVIDAFDSSPAPDSDLEDVRHRQAWGFGDLGARDPAAGLVRGTPGRA